MRLALTSETRESCQLELLDRTGRAVRVQLMAVSLARAEPLVLLAIQELAQHQPSAGRSGLLPVAEGRSDSMGRDS